MKENVLKANKITSISEAHGLVKQRKIENAVKDIMDALGLDLSDDSLCETPKRVAKMYVNEIFAGLNEDISSKLKSFDNSYGYKKTLVTDNVAVVLEARHMCVEMRGVKDSGAETKTMELRGKFNNKMKNTLFQQLC